ncbi:unannotated protein [freshwater metagenome]|uniref:Unannotated protein n=1 Tax=freshwater metagenome TaxID=449393 RepID=A0A6J6ZUZ2_9ZZZZ
MTSLSTITSNEVSRSITIGCFTYEKLPTTVRTATAKPGTFAAATARASPAASSWPSDSTLANRSSASTTTSKVVDNRCSNVGFGSQSSVSANSKSASNAPSARNDT